MANGEFELAATPSHLIRRVQQFHGDLFMREAGVRDLTKPQFTLLVAIENNEGINQTALVEMTGIDRSTVADTIRRLHEKGLIARERTEKDGRTNAVSLTNAGRKELRLARNAADRAERMLLEPLPPSERARFLKYLEMIAQAHESMLGTESGKFRRRMNRRVRP